MSSFKYWNYAVRLENYRLKKNTREFHGIEEKYRKLALVFQISADWAGHFYHVFIQYNLMLTGFFKSILKFRAIYFMHTKGTDWITELHVLCCLLTK